MTVSIVHLGFEVRCPLCNESLPRDRQAWIGHMRSTHGFIDWTLTPTLSAQSGIVDGGDLKMVPTCYGCGSTFRTKSELVSHLHEHSGIF
jgi:uncharacterized C2H2 Zn-finger protein